MDVLARQYFFGAEGYIWMYVGKDSKVKNEKECLIQVKNQRGSWYLKSVLMTRNLLATYKRHFLCTNETKEGRSYEGRGSSFELYWALGQ
jgi:hypothetical protein